MDPLLKSELNETSLDSNGGSPYFVFEVFTQKRGMLHTLKAMKLWL